ncbi:MAG: aminotransferase class IV [Chloroflexota bacterium]
MSRYTEHTMIHTWQITSKQTKQIEHPRHASLDEITRQLPDGFYSTFRTYGQGTRVIGLKAHLQRLYQPVKSPDASEETLREKLRLLLKDYPNEARVRVVMTTSGQLYLAMEALKRLPREIYENGVRVETVEMARNTPRLKSTAFISASQDERKHIARQGIFEALMVKNGRISEGMTSNFFYVAQVGNLRYIGTTQRGILLGVTRRAVIRVARGIGLDVRYQPLKRDQLEVAREAFITSSSRGIVPVIRIDEVTVGEGMVGAVTRQLAAAYEAYVLEKAEKL